MWLITMNQWLGPGINLPPDQKIEVTNTIVSFYTTTNLPHALKKILNHQVAYNQRYRLAVNFTLLGAQEIPPVPDTVMDALRVSRVEFLQQKPEDFNT